MKINRIISVILLTVSLLASTAEALVYRVAQLEGPNGKRVTLCYDMHVPNNDLASKQSEDLLAIVKAIEASAPGSSLLRYEGAEPFSKMPMLAEFLNANKEIFKFSSQRKEDQLLCKLEQLQAHNPQLMIKKAMLRIDGLRCFQIGMLATALTSNLCDRAQTEDLLAQVRQALFQNASTRKGHLQQIKEYIMSVADLASRIIASVPDDCTDAKDLMRAYQEGINELVALIDESNQQPDQALFYSRLFEHYLEGSEGQFLGTALFNLEQITVGIAFGLVPLAGPIELDCIAAALDSPAPQDIFFATGATHADIMRNFFEKVAYKVIFDTGYVTLDGEVTFCDGKTLLLEDDVLGQAKPNPEAVEAFGDAIQQNDAVTGFKLCEQFTQKQHLLVEQRLRPVDFVQLAPQLIAEISNKRERDFPLDLPSHSKKQKLNTEDESEHFTNVGDDLPAGQVDCSKQLDVDAKS